MNLNVKDISIKIGAKQICESLSIQIHSGQLWGLLGPNGCGKTTLLHTLAGFHPFFNGDIFIGENSIKHLPIKSIAQVLAILFQDFSAQFPQTVWDYCCSSRYPHLPYCKRESAEDKKIVMAALQIMELDSLLQKNILKLSGGEKRRLALAAIFAQTPSIYLLDEPTNHLDLRHQIKVLTYLKKLVAAKKAAVLMSLHDINLAQQFCDHILLLFPDGIILQGPINSMLTSEHLSRLYQHPIMAIKADNHIQWKPNFLV